MDVCSAVKALSWLRWHAPCLRLVKVFGAKNGAGFNLHIPFHLAEEPTARMGQTEAGNGPTILALVGWYCSLCGAETGWPSCVGVEKCPAGHQKDTISALAGGSYSGGDPDGTGSGLAESAASSDLDSAEEEEGGNCQGSHRANSHSARRGPGPPFSTSWPHVPSHSHPIATHVS